MKNAIKWLGIIALVTAVGFTFVSCKDKDDGGITQADIHGAWKDLSNGDTITFSGNTFEWKEGDILDNEDLKGTYTINGNKITLTITHEFDGINWKDVTSDSSLAERKITITVTSFSSSQITLKFEDGPTTYTYTKQ